MHSQWDIIYVTRSYIKTTEHDVITPRLGETGDEANFSYVKSVGIIIGLL